MKIGICGVGRFSKCFIPLFQAHPLVDEVVLADLLPDRLAAEAAHYGVRRTADSLDELCASDVDAIAIFTQRHLHGPQSLQALEAGKHVYCAVPAGQSLEELEQLVAAVERTGLIYMTGETSYYYPSTLYCRQRYQNGEFGRFAYGEAQYLHDMDHFYASFQHSGGADWKRVAGLPPMYYPTHTVSMVLSVTGATVTQVSCLGFVDQHEDGIFREGANLWDNRFSNESALMRTSDGGALRINEMRRVGWRGGNSVSMSFFGTEGSFEQNAVSSCWLTKDASEMQDVTALLDCQAMAGHDHLPESEAPIGEEFFVGVSKVHAVDRLPDAFRGQPNGHYGSHQFLVDDFVQGVSEGQQPPCHVWNAASWCAPGLVAHESAKREGALLPVPQYRRPATTPARSASVPT